MTTKNRLAQLEKRKPQAQTTRREFTKADNIAHERSMNALADALTEIVSVPITSAEVEKALMDLHHGKE